MKFTIATVLLVTLLLFSTIKQAVASVELVGITNGIICKPMMPTQSNLVEYKSWGLLNKTTDQDIWVGCPFFQLQSNVETPAIGALINMVNRNNFEVSGSCLFREVSPTGTLVNTVSNAFTLAANAAGISGFLGPLSSGENSFTFACKLMRNTYISRVIHATSQPTLPPMES